MATPISYISTANTFGQWLVATQALITLANTIIDSNVSFGTSNTITFGDGTTLSSNTSIVNAYNKANSAFDKANLDVTNISTTNGVYGNSSVIPVIVLEANGRVSSITNVSIDTTFTQASFDKANTANVTAQAGFDKANSANVTAQAGFDKANSANVLAQAAFDKANNALANTGGTISGNLSVTGNIILTNALNVANGGTGLKTLTVGSLLKGNGTNSIASAVAGTDFVKPDTTSNFTKGYTATTYNAGTKSTGTFTPDPTNGNFQKYSNAGAHTLAPPSSDCTMIIKITNASGAGAITTSSFTKVTGSFTTTVGHIFFAYITKCDSSSELVIRALQ
jgi:hypothetical protein